MTIGLHGKVTSEEARKLAISHLGSTVKGADPAEERGTKRKAMSVSTLCDEYIAAAERGLIIGKKGKAKKSSTLDVDKGRIERHIKPLLGRKPVRELVASDIHRFIRDVTVGKTATVEKTEKLRGKAIVLGGAGTAARTVGLLGGILTYAVSEGVIDSNPVRGVKRPADKKKQRRLSPDEYRRLGRSLLEAANEGETSQAIHAVWLLALTGCRKDEIVSLRWSEVDSTNMCLRLEDSKTDASIRPMGGPVLDVLSQIEKQKEQPYVLPGVRGDGCFGGLPRAWGRIRERADIAHDVTLHTLRHSYASVAGDVGFAESTIAALIGHAGGTVTSRYVHRLDSVVVAGADKVARAVLAQMTGMDAP